MHDFPLKKKRKHGIRTLDLPNNKFKLHLFFQFVDGGTLLNLDPGPKGVSTL